jgi:hypothetical protein
MMMRISGSKSEDIRQFICRQEEEQSNRDDDVKIFRYSILLRLIKVKGLRKIAVAFFYGISYQHINLI